MSLHKTAVFLASRFEEFSELRKQLKELIAHYPMVQLAPIDLNDGNVSHRPPLAECPGYVRRAEFMILLLGDTHARGWEEDASRYISMAAPFSGVSKSGGSTTRKHGGFWFRNSAASVSLNYRTGC